MIEDGRKKGSTYKNLKNNKKKPLFKNNMCILKLIWKKDASNYL